MRRRRWWVISVLVLLAVVVLLAADTLITTDVSNATDTARSWGPYYISPTVGVIAHIDGGHDISFSRTTDGGVNWSQTEIETGTTERVIAWFDQETPGDTGTLVHIAWLDSADDEAKYVHVDVSDGAVGTVRVIDATNTVDSTGELNNIAITKARSGKLIVVYSTQTEAECYRSTDNFVTPVACDSTVIEVLTDEDMYLLFPANVDDGDAAMIFADRNGVSYSVKMFDDSANTWTETAIIDVTDMNQSYGPFDGAVRHSDGLIFVCGWSEHIGTTADLRTFTANPNSIASPTIDSTTANVVTNLDESWQCALSVNQQNDDIYVAYLKGGTTFATVDLVYHASDDGMGTWGTEQAYSETTDDYRDLQGGRTIGTSGGFYQPFFYNEDTTALSSNLVNDVAVAAQVASSGQNGLLLGVWE